MELVLLGRSCFPIVGPIQEKVANVAVGPSVDEKDRSSNLDSAMGNRPILILLQTRKFRQIPTSLLLIVFVGSGCTGDIEPSSDLDYRSILVRLRSQIVPRIHPPRSRNLIHLNACATRAKLTEKKNVRTDRGDE